ncbi:Protein BREAST CANCER SUSCEPTIBILITY 1 [Heracleum sosnowskyi]|uniref:Protein BREAST CANCER SUSCEPTIBILITY 1 n=1 Tax=Heracleum sosnowskyi TaxID=360622 RepID=A0AAD8MM56_9APIA|nr:Protein BREAST CANCER SUSCEPTIBILITY 1 [Heracleum sosnowskyi]
MDSSSHLEKMGRELKCPICLSLLDSAVSLTCNHVFCNVCIQRSMKSASDCPVCKVPYRRREVRPAPHMDNLVNIYKSMEIASGANIFVSQSVPLKKFSGEENQPEADDELGEKGQTCSKPEDPVNPRKLKGNKSKGYSSKNSSSDTMRPSFPTNKRIQVPQHPLPETPTQSKRQEIILGKQTKIEPQRGAVVKEDRSSLAKKDNLDLCPFFWLQNEEDADKCTLNTVEDTFVDTPPDIPSFSDLKDADDELQCNMAPKNGPSVTSHNADLFDSEMFEWTQRACSPELCSSPMKMQVEETDRHNEMGGKTTAEDIVKDMEDETSNAVITNSQSCGNDIIADGAALAFSNVDHTGNKARTTRHKKRSKKARKFNQIKRAKLMESNNVLRDVAEDSSQTEKVYNTGNRTILSHVEEKTNIKANRACPSPKGVKSLNSNSSHMLVVDLFPSLDDKDGSSKGIQKMQRKRAMQTCIDPKDVSEHKRQNQNLDKVSNPINTANSCEPKRRMKKIYRDPGATKTSSENVCTSIEGSKPMQLADESISAVDVFVAVNDKEGTSRSQKLKSSGKCCTTNIQHKGNYSRRSKLLEPTTDSDAIVHQKGTGLGSDGGKISSRSMIDSKSCGQLNYSKKENCIQADDPKFIAPNDCQYIHAKKTQLSGKLSDVSPKNNSLLSMSGTLRKCEKRSNNIQCSFCHSVEDSEASGVMVHYLNGKPVEVGCSEAGSVIHVHRNCAEWAPNVYFEDDVAINLVAELARSKRIKCGCCGLKGAALGCYDKSCRRSFHVPCAKLTPQCRWDNENFVMLCPLHASSKLPNENFKFQSEQKEKSLSRRQLPISQPKLAVKQDDTTSCRWNSQGVSAKLVLCCSALTIAEKETVSEFVMLSGVKVLKNWDSSVTHIIASTDENGTCRRTLKFLMGILEGKWILSIEWVKACLKAKENVNEQQYEIDVDIHGVRGGPRQGRLRLLNKQPRLFDGYKFYFIGDFQPSYRGYLHDLLIAAGGTILHRKPISGDNEAALSTFIIYSLELPDKCNPSNRILIVNSRRTDAEKLASSCQAVVATNSWILNSIAACKLQNLAE